MSRIVLTLIAAAIGLAASSSFAADSCPAPCLKLPTDSRYVSYQGPLPGGLNPILVGTLAKGKAKRVVVVEGAVHTQDLGTPLFLTIKVDVNGITMEPLVLGNGIYETDCTAGGSGMPWACTVSGTFWLDIDQNPSLNGVPLTVTLAAQNVAGAFLLSVNASVSIRLEKK